MFFIYVFNVLLICYFLLFLFIYVFTHKNFYILVQESFLNIAYTYLLKFDYKHSYGVYQCTYVMFASSNNPKSPRSFVRKVCPDGAAAPAAPPTSRVGISADRSRCSVLGGFHGHPCAEDVYPKTYH